MGRRLFCEYGPICYRISAEKEILRRKVSDLFSRTRFARQRQAVSLPVIVKGHTTLMLRRLEGVEPTLQQSKVVNLRLASGVLDGLMIAPGEVFSFWHLLGRCTRRKGYQDGLTISGGSLGQDVGGGLCQLANLIHYLVLHSPLTVTELHHHSDALFPDSERRVPFGTGTSVFYCNVDYRFQNTTDRPVQLRLWIDGDQLCGELRSAEAFSLRYRLVEEHSRYTREPDGFYRNSEVYRLRFDRASGAELPRERILVNHSRVMYDPALIPPEQMEPTPEETTS
ncbi:MAG: VanW family protein [Oscillospiraceae bacterium]